MMNFQTPLECESTRTVLKISENNIFKNWDKFKKIN